MVSLDEKYKFKYRGLASSDRAFRNFRKIFYERWEKTYGTEYKEGPVGGEFLIKNTKLRYPKSELMMKKLAAGRTADFDFNLFVDVLVSHPWKNIPSSQLENENEIILACGSHFYEGFYDTNNDKEPTEKSRKCNEGCEHSEQFNSWNHLKLVTLKVLESIFVLDKTMSVADWTKQLNSWTDNSDDLELKPLYPNLDEMGEAMVYKYQADEMIKVGNEQAAIQFISLALDYRGLTENFISDLYFSRGKCWLQWCEKVKTRMQQYINIAKSDIERSLYIRPCRAEGYAVIAKCFAPLKKSKKAAYFYKLASDLEPNNKKYKDGVRSVMVTSKQKSAFAEPIESDKVLSVLTRAGSLPQMDTIKFATEISGPEAEKFILVSDALIKVNAKQRREYFDKNPSLEYEPAAQTSKFFYQDLQNAEKMFTKSKGLNETVFADVFVAMGDYYRSQGNLEKAKQMYTKATHLPIAMSTGYKMNTGIGEANLNLGRLLLLKPSEPSAITKALENFQKSLEYNDGENNIVQATLELGKLYCQIDGCGKGVSITKNNRLGQSYLEVASIKGSSKASQILANLSKKVTSKWEERVKVKVELDQKVPFVFANVPQEVKVRKSAREIQVIKEFRQLLKDHENDKLIRHKEYSGYSNGFPENPRITMKDYKLVAQSSFDQGGTNPLADLMPDMRTIFEKCFFQGTLAAQPLVRGDDIELLLWDVQGFPCRFAVEGGECIDPSSLKVGGKYSFIAFSTCRSKFDNQKIHDCNWIVEGPTTPSPCANCGKTCTQKCSKCITNYCDRDCQTVDWQSEHKLICGLKSFKDRWDETPIKN
ncbi:hypothetical protein ACTFIW_011930 [Dictyostelium discoideum]